MTEEQIKQNAEEYVNRVAPVAPVVHQATGVPLAVNQASYRSYIAGAHSRDEEIERLREWYHDMILTLEYKVEQLRNPWISVNDKLPDENCVVFVSLDGTEYLSAHYRAKSKRFVTVSKDKQTLVEVRKSAATYTVCGDCIKEEYLYSEGEKEDITSIVTHWMPKPELKKGE